MPDPLTHITSARIARPAADVMAYLVNPENFGEWQDGMRQTEIIGPRSVKGVTVSGKPAFAEIHDQPDEGAIFFHLGSDPADLTPRIMMRIVDGDHLDASPQECVVSMIAWRLDSMDDKRWRGLIDTHEAEIVGLKKLIEETQ